MYNLTFEIMNELSAIIFVLGNQFAFFHLLTSNTQWAFVLPARRVIRIDHRKGYKDQVFYTGPAVHRQASSCRHLIATSEPPSLLYTCRQSRALCLKHYHLSFGGILLYPFYFNPVQDIILLANKQVLDDLCAHYNARMLEQYGVRFLALDPILTWRNDSAYDTVHFHVNGQWQAAKSLVDGVKKFATLSRLTVLYPNHSYDCNTHHCHWSLPVGVFFGKRLKKILRRKHLEDRTWHSERPLRQPQTQISNQTMGSVTWAMPKMFLTEYKTTADGRNDMEEQLLAHMDDGIDHKVKNEDVD
jgi:hypothetical protein